MINNSQKYKPSPNSLKNTFCVFVEVEHSEIEGLTIDYASKSGSQYYYTQQGMYRLANHWGRLANAKWRLIDLGLNENKFKVGFAPWENFYPDNDTDNCYYLEMDWESNQMQYQHKNNPAYNNKAILRNTKETQKRLKLARTILTKTQWAKHFHGMEIQELQTKIIQKLIDSNETIHQIKSDLMPHDKE